MSHTYLDSVLALTQRAIGHWGFALVLHRLETSSKGDVPGLHLCRQLFVLNLLLHFMRHPELVLRGRPENQHIEYTEYNTVLKEPSVLAKFYT